MSNPPTSGKSHASGAAPSDSKFELLLFRLGVAAGSQQRELFGINVFKVREIVVNPPITYMVNAPEHLSGLANVRGQLIPVIDLPKIASCTPQTDHGVVLVTEFGRTTQAFRVDEVVEIVQVEWRQVVAADSSGGGLVSGVARLDGDKPESRLAQVLDVEQILNNVFPRAAGHAEQTAGLPKVQLPPGTVILVADDSAVARMLIEESLRAMGVPFVDAKNGKEAWERLEAFQASAAREGKTIRDKVALVLTDLEMPEMDGFTLTRNIKGDSRYAGLPVIVHSSLTGSATEGHASSVGADAYIAKFEPQELAECIRQTLNARAH